jgi:DNA-binding XRE family transcriptional regulator
VIHPGPDPEQVMRARQRAGLNRADAAALVYVSEHTFRSWESDTGSARGRRMPRGLWELFCIKTLQPSRKRQESPEKPQF